MIVTALLAMKIEPDGLQEPRRNLLLQKLTEEQAHAALAEALKDFRVVVEIPELGLWALTLDQVSPEALQKLHIEIASQAQAIEHSKRHGWEKPQG